MPSCWRRLLTKTRCPAKYRVVQCVRTRRRLSSAGLIHPRRMRRWLWDSRCGPAWMPESQSTIAWSSTPTDSGCYRNRGLEPVGGVGGVGAAISASTRVRSSSSGAQRSVLAVSSTSGALRRTAASFNRRKARSRSGGSGGIFLRSAPGVVLGVRRHGLCAADQQRVPGHGPDSLPGWLARAVLVPA